MRSDILCTLLCAAGALMLASSSRTAAEPTLTPMPTNAPSITISSVPSDYPGEPLASRPIEGQVSGVNPADVRVVIYALGDVYYVQPWFTRTFTSVKPDGKWSTTTHGGFEFVALLVKPSYRPKATLTELPRVGGDVLAMARKKPGE